MKSLGRWFKVQLLELVRTPDGQGGFTVVPTDRGTVSGQINPLKPYEKVKFEKIDHRIDHRFIFRYQVPIKAAMRLICRGRTFETVGPAINLDERDRFKEILAYEVSL